LIYKNLYSIADCLKFDEEYINILKKYWQLLCIGSIYCDDMMHNDNKNELYPNDNVAKFIKEFD
jgi:hypothetical protein